MSGVWTRRFSVCACGSEKKAGLGDSWQRPRISSAEAREIQEFLKLYPKVQCVYVCVHVKTDGCRWRPTNLPVFCCASPHILLAS